MERHTNVILFCSIIIATFSIIYICVKRKSSKIYVENNHENNENP